MAHFPLVNALKWTPLRLRLFRQSVLNASLSNIFTCALNWLVQCKNCISKSFVQFVRDFVEASFGATFASVFEGRQVEDNFCQLLVSIRETRKKWWKTCFAWIVYCQVLVGIINCPLKTVFYIYVGTLKRTWVKFFYI